MRTIQKDSTLGKVLMNVRPEYFSWTRERQERYHVAKSSEDNFRLEQQLLRILFGITVTTVDENMVVDLTDEQATLLHSTMLPVEGVGEDLFTFAEPIHDEEMCILDFKTLHDFLLRDHELDVRTACEGRDPLYPDFYYQATLIIDERFRWASVASLARYVKLEIEEVAERQIAELIPHRMVPGPRHGRRENRGYRIDMRYEANGLEGQIEELNYRSIQYQMRLPARYVRRFQIEARSKVYVVDTTDCNPSKEFIFTDTTSLRSVRFRHFLEDCRRIIGDPNEVLAVIEEERQAVLDFIEREYRDILDNFDPKVLPFRKKLKAYYKSAWQLDRDWANEDPPEDPQ